VRDHQEVLLACVRYRGLDLAVADREPNVIDQSRHPTWTHYIALRDIRARNIATISLAAA
jgi:hypothetical protein